MKRKRRLAIASDKTKMQVSLGYDVRQIIKSLIHDFYKCSQLYRNMLTVLFIEIIINLRRIANCNDAAIFRVSH